MTADSSAATSTTPAVDSINSGDSIDSGGKNLPSPWAQVVRVGIESNSISPVPSPATVDSPVLGFSDPVTAATAVDVSPVGDGCNAGAGGGVVRSPWSKGAVNGVVEAPVMGAAMWPALSESTRLPVKSVSSSSELADPAAVPAAVDQAPVIIVPQPPVKQVKPNHTHTHTHTRQRSFKRNGSVSGPTATSANVSRPPAGTAMPPPFPLVDMYGNLVPLIPEPSQPPFKPNTWSTRPVDQSMNRHPVRRNNNFSPRPVNNGYNGRPPHQVGPPPPQAYRGFVRQPVFLPHMMRPYGPPIGYEMGAPYVYVPTLAQVPYRGGAPVFTSMPMTPTDSFLHDEIVKQIEYYFSDDNLVKDSYLRSHMDVEGWVPITLIAGFPKVQALTSDIQILLSTLRDSNTVEIQGDKLRRRGDWRKWTNTPCEVIEASLQKLTLVDESTNGDIPCA